MGMNTKTITRNERVSNTPMIEGSHCARLEDKQRLAEMTRGASETELADFAQKLGAALGEVKMLPLPDQLVTWDRLATFPTVIHHYMPRALQRGAELAVFNKSHATALPFLRAAAYLCSGWTATVAHLLTAACCKELSDAEGTASAIDAFEQSCATLTSLDLRSMRWKIPSLDPTGYDLLHGPDWFCDEGAAVRYVKNVERRAELRAAFLLSRQEKVDDVTNDR